MIFLPPGLSHLDPYQVQQETQYGPPLGQPYEGFLNYDLPSVGEVVGQPYPLLEPQYPPVVEYQVPVDYPENSGQWRGLPPCNCNC